MKWLEVALRVDADSAETVAEMLATYTYQGVVLERGDIPDVDAWDEGNIPPASYYNVRAYLPQDAQLEQAQSKIRVYLERFGYEAPVFRPVEEQDWAEAWKAHYHPLRIGERIVVRPLWETVELQPGDVEIALDPGMAFGTGTHPTTQLCLQALSDWLDPNTDVLDLGCGSAILSIAAAKLGAESVYAIDNDPVAVEAAADNLQQNGVAAQVELATGSLEEVQALSRQFDFALVNILARIIIPMAQAGLSEVIKPGGTAIFAGLIRSQQAEVEETLQSNGLEVIDRRTMDEWVLLKARRTSADT